MSLPWVVPRLHSGVTSDRVQEVPPYIIINQLMSSEELSLDEFLLSEATFYPDIIEVEDSKLATLLSSLEAVPLGEFGEQAVGVIALTNGASVEVGQLADHRVPAGIETRSATDKSSLSESIAALRGKERIFIDTSGLSFRDPDMAKQLEWLTEQIPPIRIMLVISAAAQMGTTRELLRRVGATRLDGAIITKVDEAVSLGGVIDTLIKRRLPLSLLVDNRDPDIVPLNTDPVVFVDRALALVNERQVSQSIGRSKYAPANAKVYA